MSVFFSDELRQLRTEREKLEKETEQWKAEQTNEWNKQHKYVLLAKCDIFISTICEIEIYEVQRSSACFHNQSHPYIHDL